MLFLRSCSDVFGVRKRAANDERACNYPAEADASTLTCRSLCESTPAATARPPPCQTTTAITLRLSRSRCIYGCDTLRCSCCLRHP